MPWRIALPAALAVGALSGCAPQPLSTAEINVVATVQDSARDYSQLRTFAMPDRVIDLCDQLAIIPPETLEAGGAGGAGSGLGGGGGDGGASDSGCAEVDHSVDDAILDELAAQLKDLGYRRIDDVADETPDLAVIAGLVAQESILVWRGVPWCFPHPLYGGCWVPDYRHPFRLSYGTLLVDLVVTSETKNGTLSSAWTAVFGGVGLAPANKTKVTAALKTAFAQSSYLADGGEP